MAHLLKYDSVMGALRRATVEGRRRRHRGRRRADQGARRARPARRCRGATSASTWSSSRPASSPTATRPPPTSTPARPASSSRPRATGADATFVIGVNDDTFDPATHKVVSNASLHHQLLRADGQGARRRLRRREGPDDHGPRLHRRPEPASTARTATSAGPAPRPSTSSRRRTGAARATGLVLESMKGKLDGTRCGCPVPDGSITDFTGILQPRRHRRRGQRGVPGGGRAAARWPRCSSYTEDADRVVRHRRLAGIVHLRRRRSPWPWATWSRCSAGTTTSGATRTAWSTWPCIVGAANQ